MHMVFATITESTGQQCFIRGCVMLYDDLVHIVTVAVDTAARLRIACLCSGVYCTCCDAWLLNDKCVARCLHARDITHDSCQ